MISPSDSEKFTPLNLPESRVSPNEFEAYLKIAREQKVLAFKLGDLAVQFVGEALDLGPSPLIEDADKHTAGNWKRGPDIDETEWD